MAMAREIQIALAVCGLLSVSCSSHTSSQHRDCRFAADACATGFTCLQSGTSWQCVPEETPVAGFTDDAGERDTSVDGAPVAEEQTFERDLESQELSYRFVVIEDAGPSRTTPVISTTAGVDLVGVALCIDGFPCNEPIWADRVAACSVVNITNCRPDNSECSQWPGVTERAADCLQAVGEPMGADSLGNCETDDPDFVSLGGVGGFLAVTFNSSADGLSSLVLDADVVIKVIECDPESSGEGELYNASVGMTPDPSDPNHNPVSCLTSRSGFQECALRIP